MKRLVVMEQPGMGQGTQAELVAAGLGVTAMRAEADRAVFSRAVAILASFADSPWPVLTLTEIAVRTAFPLTTVHRLCGQLVAERMLERVQGGGFRVGLRLWELGTLAPRSSGLRDIALPYLEDLYEITRQHVQLMVLDGHEAVVIERLSSKTAPQLLSRAGGRLPLHASTAGIALLAYAGETVVQRVLDAGLARYTEDTISTEEELRAATAAVRSSGYIEMRNQITVGAVSIASPIIVGPNRAVGAVSTVVDESADPRVLVPAILTSARAIARAVMAGPGRGRTNDDR